MSRYIASWMNVGGEFIGTWADSSFSRWLRTVGVTNEEDIHDMWELATCGKFELERSAERYRQANKEEDP
jgi:hypothetical protein